MEAILKRIDSALLQIKEGRNDIRYNGKGQLPFTEEELRTRLTEHIRAKKQFVHITECIISYRTKMDDYNDGLDIVYSIPLWHPMRWVLGTISSIEYLTAPCSKKRYSVYVVLEPYNGFLSAATSMYVDGHNLAPIGT
jgi:hypothetical protein